MNFPQPKAAAGVSKDTRMSTAKNLDQVWQEINALGGSSEQNNSYDQGIVDTVAKALEIVERAQAVTAPSDQCVAREALPWPSREVIAREIRLAMLDNPTDEAFNKRAEKREAIANDAADIILARFALAVPQAAVADTMTDQRLLEDMTLADNARRVAIRECASIALAIDSGRGNEKEIAKAIRALTNPAPTELEGK
jgi:hypothetical protein